MFLIQAYSDAEVITPSPGQAAGTLFLNTSDQLALKKPNSSVVILTGVGEGAGAVTSVAGKTGVVTLAKADVGLSNVDNTADANKPVSTAQATSIATKQATLVSGTNIKTINGTSILGSGNIVVAGGTNGTNGRGITGIALTGTAGLVKTYTITFTDSTTTTFQVTDGADGTGGSGGASIPAYSADVTAARNIAKADLQNLLIYNSAANANFTIPTDATLELTGATNASFEIYQKGNGVPNFVAGAGVTLVKWAGYPTSALGVTQTAHRVGVNTWAVK